MRFKQGARVEVLGRDDEPYGSWVLARILSRDGCWYGVRYELLLARGGEPVEETVHEKDVRPFCPPPAGEAGWGFGDVAEAFDLYLWRVGKIAKVLHNGWFVVRLCGSGQLKKFHVSDLRVRQAWHDGRWIMLGKGNENEQLYDSSKGVAYPGSEADNVKREDAHTMGRYQQDYVQKLPSGGNVNRTSAAYDSSQPGDTVVRGSKKKRKLASEVRGCHHQPVKTSLPRKVDASPLPNDLAEKNCIRSSSTPLKCVEESIECSVASCSSNGLADYTIHNRREDFRAVADSSNGDATSPTYPSKAGRGCASVSEDELAAASIHELELHAYKTTMLALFASGPLSWEQESLLTNLRLSLHISNEEHLHQLRHLLSSRLV
ncbi:Uncharacterized protein M6B38_219900 [Iris pallida]|uniref:ENT domain-containing protein n=1 Tax=Iris pallida TaxID=29817 RepID=A0AAX6DYG7_IRIPA|nr:Uncharacterized protein M6B38_219900 [Iris pallida]